MKPTAQSRRRTSVTMLMGWRYCPSCGNRDLEAVNITQPRKGQREIYVAECKKCGWKAPL